MQVLSSGIYISATTIAVFVVIGFILYLVHLKDKQKREAEQAEREAERRKEEQEREKARQERIKAEEEKLRRNREEQIIAVSNALKRLSFDSSYESAKQYVDWNEGKEDTPYDHYLGLGRFSITSVIEDGVEYDEEIDPEDAWYSCIRYNQYRHDVLQLLCNAFESHWPDYPYKGEAVRQYEELIANKIEVFPPQYDEVHSLVLKVPRFWLTIIREMHEVSPDDPDYIKPEKRDFCYPFGITPQVNAQPAKSESENDYDEQFMEIARNGKFLSVITTALDEKKARFVFRGSEFEALLVGGWFDEESLSDQGKQDFVHMVMEGRGIPSLPGDLLGRACLAADCDLLLVQSMLEPDLECVGNEYLDSTYEFLSNEMVGLALQTEKGYMWNLDKMLVLLTQIGIMRGIDQSKSDQTKALWALKIDTLQRIMFSVLHSSEINSQMNETIVKLEKEKGPRSSNPELDLICMSLVPCDMKEMPLFLETYLKVNCFDAVE